MKIHLSVVVIVYKMKSQALRTLYSLSNEYQLNTHKEEYEVIVIENESDEMLSQDEISSLKGNFYYFSRKETTQSPVNAINFGAEKASGSHIAIMIDGARMLSPMVVYYTLLACRTHSNPVIAIPGYHLGHKPQSISAGEGYSAKDDDNLLKQINWPHHAYSLFDIACFSDSTARGFLVPLNESNFVVVQRSLFFDLGGYCTLFDKNGGGFANLDFYKRVCESTNIQLFLLFSEGTFHQFHSGETTGKHQKSDTEKLINNLSAEYIRIRGAAYSAPSAEPTLLGHYHAHVKKFLQHSAAIAGASANDS